MRAFEPHNMQISVSLLGLFVLGVVGCHSKVLSSWSVEIYIPIVQGPFFSGSRLRTISLSRQHDSAYRKMKFRDIYMYMYMYHMHLQFRKRSRNTPTHIHQRTLIPHPRNPSFQLRNHLVR